LKDTKQRSKEKSYALRLKRRKNQIETLDSLADTTPRKNKSCAEMQEEKQSN